MWHICTLNEDGILIGYSHVLDDSFPKLIESKDTIRSVRIDRFLIIYERSDLGIGNLLTIGVKDG